METMNAIATLLGNGFFPIMVCAVLFWYIYKKDQAHKEEINELRKSIDKNTEVIQKVVDAMGVRYEQTR